MAVEFFEKAIKEDPNFALAYVGLADCYLILVDQGVVRPIEGATKTRTLTEKALELDATLAEASCEPWECNHVHFLGLGSRRTRVSAVNSAESKLSNVLITSFISKAFPGFEDIRADEKFIKLIERMGLGS